MKPIVALFVAVISGAVVGGLVGKFLAKCGMG
jgi:hypothetical protein